MIPGAGALPGLDVTGLLNGIAGLGSALASPPAYSAASQTGAPVSISVGGVNASPASADGGGGSARKANNPPLLSAGVLPDLPSAALFFVGVSVVAALVAGRLKR